MTSMSPSQRRAIDVSELPRVVFGHRGTLWWGALGFVVTEGATLGIACWAYFYLRKNFESWPPPPYPVPGMAAGTIGVALLLIAIWVMTRARARALELDAPGTLRWLIVAGLLAAAISTARAFELASLNVRWDDNAYGSILWLLMGLHATLVVTDVFETAGLALIIGSSKRELKHFSDVDDAALYQWFLSLVWVPIYVMVYWLPRLHR
jgi:cytochrome c oxidase subunit III